jgi:hypothetical protein
MDSVQQIVALLISERDRITQALEALNATTKRRGRPPKNNSVSTVYASVPSASGIEPARKRRGMTAAQKKAHGARMKAYWAKRRKEAAA